MAKSFESGRFPSNPSDSGVFLLDPKDRAELQAWGQGLGEETEDEAHERFLAQARRLPQVRLEKVMKIREEIAAGTYMTEEKLEATVERLLQVLRGR